MKFTISAMVSIASMCLFAVDAQAADSIKSEREAAYKSTVAKADSDYSAAKDACKAKSGHDKDLCLQEAKAAHVSVVADAKARRKANAAMADARDDKMDAQYKVAKEKCDALSGAANDTCIRDAKAKYKQ